MFADSLSSHSVSPSVNQNVLIYKARSVIGELTNTCLGLVQVISKADFIATVVNFDTDSLTSPVIKTVEEVFKAAGDLTAEAVTRASKACGPLYNVRRPHPRADELMHRVDVTSRSRLACQLRENPPSAEMYRGVGLKL